jgi:predicted enzyme related to lactoylglutathione lyase
LLPVIDTTLLLSLIKMEIVSGSFGGYFSDREIVMSEGTVSYIEIGSGAESQQTAGFFEKLFDWPCSEMEGGNYWFQAAGIRAGLHPNDPSPGITVFFKVANLNEAVARVKELGGTATPPGPAETGFGQFSMCTDPQGVPFGLHLATTA